MSPGDAATWRGPARLAAALLLGVSAICSVHAGQGAADAGEAIYRDGILGSGAPLIADRENGIDLKGADAACVNCHRRSGYGSVEGLISVPPISGRYLMQSGGREADETLPFVETKRVSRGGLYTDATLARAIRDGVDAQGKPFNYLMPRFAMSDQDMASLIAYLKGLDRRQLPGVVEGTVHFATIVTPDADPVKRDAMLDVIRDYFAERNSVQIAKTPTLRTSSKGSWAKGMFHASRQRQWALHVWQLSGPADTWQAQLEHLFAEQPVLAVLSGLGGADWEPVQRFCENERLPCLFPNVEVPPKEADHDFYSLYFSQGVLLEADLIANRILKAQDGKPARTVQQVYRSGDSGDAAAGELAAALERRGIAVQRRALAADLPGEAVAKAVGGIPAADTLVLWLRPADVAALGKAPRVPDTVYMSGLMGGLEDAPVPPGWRGNTHVAYPFDLPDHRVVQVDYALGWFRIRHIPVVDEQVQVDTFLACGVLTETLAHMIDNLSPEYLVERIQDMLTHRLVTGYYPRLALATGQRFASKGGYLVHFADPKDNKVVADSGWIVPDSAHDAVVSAGRPQPLTSGATNLRAATRFGGDP